MSRGALTVVLCLAILAAAQDTHSTAAKAASPPVTVTAQDNGKEIDLPQGSTLLVTLASNPTTGYSWAVQGDPSPSPLKLLKTTYKKGKQSEGMAGAPGMQELRFSATSAGVANLTLEYRRPWEHDVAPAKKFSVQVKVR